jgi:L-fuconolactonase
MKEPLSPEALLIAMDEAGVDSAILVPPSFEGDRNDVVLAAADRFPSRFAVMGRISLEDKANAEPLLETWRSLPGALGVRLTFLGGRRSGDWLADGTADWFWPAAQRLDIPVFVHAPDHLEAIGRIARQHRELRFAIDHFGLRHDLRDEAALDAVERVCALAELDNVAVKASSAPYYTSESYPFPLMQRAVERVVESFGAERVFWGSDLTRLRCSYAECLEMVRGGCAFLDDRERDLVLGEALVDWLGWAR